MKQQILSINFQVENTKRRIEVQTQNFSHFPGKRS